MNISFLALSTSMDSPTFRTLTTGLFLVLLIDYFCCWVMTFWLAWKGKILDGRSEEEKAPKRE